MRSGELRHWITIERRVDVRGAGGSSNPTWEFFARCPAKLNATGGGEEHAAQQEKAKRRTMIRVRYMVGLTEAMRITYDGTVYDIKAIAPDGTAREFFDLTCESGEDQG